MITYPLLAVRYYEGGKLVRIERLTLADAKPEPPKAVTTEIIVHRRGKVFTIRYPKARPR